VKDWIPPLDYVWVDTDIWEQPLARKYWMTLYHAVLLLTGNDIGPRGDAQVIIATVSLILGAFINANIFGELAVLISALNRKSSRF
jgi:hypothetical protein